MLNPFSNPRVSILLTSFDNSDIERAIKSILNQTYENSEIILLDDNSSDPKVLKILEKYKKHPKIKFYNSQIKEEDRLKELSFKGQSPISQSIPTKIAGYNSG